MPGGDLLRYAESLLREGDRRAARPVLLDFVQQYPRSARGWWMLSLAVTDQRQQIDCMERVLDIDPGYAPARARLEKLQQKLLPPPAARRPLPSAPSAPRPAARRAPSRQPAWLVPVVAGGLVLLLALFAVLALVVLVNMRPVVPAAPQPLLPTRTLHPTWTPTLTATPRPTLTPIPSFTPLPPLSLLGGQSGGGGSGPAFGSPSIDFTLNSVDGGRVSLSSYRGQPVLLFFWATWCPYCRNEIPALNDLYTAYKDQGLVVLAVQVAETASTGRSFRDQHGLTFPILSDTSGSVFRSYSGEAIPLNYFIDANGNVNYSQLGMMDYTSLNLRVRTLLNLIPTPVQ
jgi:peroxiredoxin